MKFPTVLSNANILRFIKKMILKALRTSLTETNKPHEQRVEMSMRKSETHSSSQPTNVQHHQFVHGVLVLFV